MVSKRVYYPTGATIMSEPISKPIRSVDPVAQKNTVKNKISTLSAGLEVNGMRAEEYVDMVAQQNPAFASSIKKYGMKIIQEASKYPRLVSDIPLIFAQVDQESNWKDYALNSVGEMSYGLFQVNKKA